jgi:hypothetical protein
MLDKYLITEEYNSLLNEELSISNRVKNAANYVTEIVLMNISKEYHVVDNFDFIGKLPILFTIRECNTQEEYNKFPRGAHVNLKNLYIQNNRIYGATLDIGEATLNGKLLEEKFLFSSVFHEIEHLYQEYEKLIKGEGVFGKGLSKTGTRKQNLYDLVVNTGIKQQNTYIRAVSWIFYLANYKEQDAYVNQLYAYMMNTKDLNLNNFDSIYKQSEIYNILKYFKTLQNNIPNWGKNNDIANYFNMISFFDQNGIKFNKTKTLKLLDSLIIRFTSKINNVIKKVKIDKRLTPQQVYEILHLNDYDKKIVTTVSVTTVAVCFSNFISISL